MKGCSRIPRHLSCFSLFSSSSSSVSLAYSSVYFSVARYRTTTTTATITVIPNTHPSPQKIYISTASCASASYSLLSRSFSAFQRLESNGALTHSRAYHATMTTTMSRMTAHADAKQVTKGEEPSSAKRTLVQKKRFPLLHMVAVVATRWFYQLLHPHPCPLSAPSWIVDTYDFSHGRIPHGSFMELLSTMYAQQQQQQRKKLAGYRQEEVVEKNGDKAIAAAAVEKKKNNASDEKGEREIDTLSPLFFLPFSGSRKMFEEQVAHTPGIVVVLLYARGWGIAIHEDARKEKENRVGRKCTPHSSPGWWGRRKKKKHVVHASSTVSPSPPPSSSSGGGSPSLTSTGKESNRSGKTTTTLSRHAQTNAVSSEEAHSGMASSNTMAHEGEHREKKEKKETYQEDKEEDENAVLWESIAIPTAERTEQQKRNRVALETIFSLHSSSSSTAVPSHDSEKKSSPCGTTTSSTEHLRTERKKNEEEKRSNEGVKDAKNAGKKPTSVILPSSSPGVLLPPFQCWTMNVYASADHMELACLYDFRATPMWLGFRDGVFIESVEGGHPTRLLSFVETLLLHHSNKPLPES